MRPLLLGAGTVLLLLAAACYPGSDAQVAARASRRESERRLRDMKSATGQTPAGQPITAASLAATVSGKTHVFAYESRPDGKSGRYVEHYFFAPGGHLAYTNTLWALAADGQPEDKWWVDGDRLCLLNTTMTHETQCFRLARTSDGRIQYVIATPGSEYDGLLTKVTDAVLDGPSAAH